MIKGETLRQILIRIKNFEKTAKGVTDGNEQGN